MRRLVCITQEAHDAMCAYSLRTGAKIMLGAEQDAINPSLYWISLEDSIYNDLQGLRKSYESISATLLRLIDSTS